MRVLTRYLSVAAAAGIIAAVLVGAKMASSEDTSAGKGSDKPSASVPSELPAPLSFAYGEKRPEQRIDTPRVGICYPFDGVVPTAFRNSTELAAQLYPAADCGGEPGVLMSPGEQRTGTAAGRGVVFVVPVEQAG
ncbi:hypothetical protein [Streptomyces xinghaiensis]|uniref:hypothetical protein n=1 Tax=Streptomyces xinghaiensis TaxID=1038928 RepID=UPI0034368A2C